MATYSEKLKNPLWQRKRLEIMERDAFHCQICFDSETTLHVHHKRYIKGAQPWEYDDCDLATVCENCHPEAHALMERIGSFMTSLPIGVGPYTADAAMSLVHGYMSDSTEIVGMRTPPAEHRDALVEAAGVAASWIKSSNLRDIFELTRLFQTYGAARVVQVASMALREEHARHSD